MTYWFWELMGSGGEPVPDLAVLIIGIIVVWAMMTYTGDL